MVYLDSSALVKLVIAGRESTALRRYLAANPRRVSCALARVEVIRAVGAHGTRAVTRARRLLRRLDLVRLDDDSSTTRRRSTEASCEASTRSTWLRRGRSATSSPPS